MNRGQIVDIRSTGKAVWGGEIRRSARLLVLLALVALSASCGDLTREGTGSAYLIISALEGASGAEPNEFGTTVASDIVTVVDDVPTVFNDLGRVRLRLALKDPGGAESPSTPTVNNFITINRYHVKYIRADGRNTPGVDVPWPFDGAITITVGSGESTAGFQLVRLTAKEEAPLRALASNGVFISTIAEITFFGHDQTGREALVTGQMLVEFGNFGDPR
jgi:hypothetical protein